MKLQYSLLALAAISGSSFAQLSDTAGFSGEVSVSTGFYSTESNLNTNDDNKQIDSLGAPSDSVSGGLILPLGNVAYTFGNGLNQQFYAGTSRDDIATGTLAFELGYKYQLASGMIINASMLPTIMSGEVWADPFVTGADRKTTDEDGNAYRLKIENIAGSKFSVDMAYATKDVENEKSGSVIAPMEMDSLRRDSNAFIFKTDYKLFLDQQTILTPRLSYISSDADGDANSFTGYGAELSYFKLLDRHQFALTGSFKTRDYDANHAYFNKTRQDDEFSLFAAYEYENIMDWQDWSLISLVGFSNSDSNINFYDQKNYIMSVGMNYHF
ncbi:DUF2860 domain-containing protein [Vibrio renipiscarius]|uniref:Periplasmic protein n=1 Tax=Vibrio renipiscarius TaxID=1461322 RepID=A0A0C2KJQ4_9VIBR|nr:DUF2860 domain-containing protein [Vibrio renipiscarius]KII78945.1 hypothetical protein OJ16_08975 [Vibrio renipiscarius]KII82553.1 hypothetical protein PL18_00115 [Vibrio renipiscarius]